MADMQAGFDDAAAYFDDAAAYERRMGRWSRAAGRGFLRWLNASDGMDWLDVGCGSGAFTELLVDTCAPASVVAVDPSAAQVGYARKQLLAQSADFRVADAQALPFEDCAFDITVSALVINFIPDQPRALIEMRRVTRPDGIVAAYVWDFAAGLSPASPIVRAMRSLEIEFPPTPGSEASSLPTLASLFESAGYEDVVVGAIGVTQTFLSFQEYWQSQLPPLIPRGKIVAALPETDRMALADTVRAALPVNADGSIACTARANMVRARVEA